MLHSSFHLIIPVFPFPHQITGLLPIPEMYAGKLMTLRKSLALPSSNNDSTSVNRMDSGHGVDSGRGVDSGHGVDSNPCSARPSTSSDPSATGVIDLPIRQPRASDWWTRSRSEAIDPGEATAAAAALHDSGDANDPDAMPPSKSSLSLLRSIQTTDNLLDEVKSMEMRLREMRGL